MLRKRLSTFLLIPVLLVAFAGDLAAKPKEPEADGILVGGFVLHPGADVALAYDGRGSQGVDDGFIEIGAHFHTHLADEDSKAWHNKLSLGWQQFFGVGDAEPNGGLNVRILSEADLFKQGTFRVEPSFGYTYVDDPEDDNLRRDFEHHQVRARLALAFQPNGGRVFSETLSYQFRGWFYTDHSDVSHHENLVASETRWNFLPQTGMSLRAEFRYIGYIEDNASVQLVKDATATQNLTSMPVRLKYSVQGLLFARFHAQIGLGYAYEYYENGPSEHMFIANARLRFDFNENSDIYLEYRKDFDNVVYGDYYKYHRGILGFEGLWFDHLQTELELGYGYFDFRSNRQHDREDSLLTANALVAYHIFPGMSVGLNYRLRYNTSDTANASYVKNLVTLQFSYEY